MKEMVVVITGAGKGIGRAMALELARNKQSAFKPRLFLLSRTQSDLDSLKNEIAKFDASLAVELHVVDLANISGVAAAMSACRAKLGPVDVLINNAGTGVFKHVGEYTVDDYSQVFDTNVKGTFFLTQNVFTHMQKAKSGTIVFVTSTAAEKAYEEGALYCASKFAQRGLLEVLRIPARKAGVRIINVMPGPVFTPMWGNVSADLKAQMVMPEDVAAMTVAALAQPPRSAIEEIVIRPVGGDLQDKPA